MRMSVSMLPEGVIGASLESGVVKSQIWVGKVALEKATSSSRQGNTVRPDAMMSPLIGAFSNPVLPSLSLDRFPAGQVRYDRRKIGFDVLVPHADVLGEQPHEIDAQSIPASRDEVGVGDAEVPENPTGLHTRKVLGRDGRKGEPENKEKRNGQLANDAFHRRPPVISSEVNVPRLTK